MLDGEFQETFDETRAKIDTGTPGFERLGPGEHSGFDFEGGWNGEMREQDGVRTVVSAKSREQRAQLDAHLARAQSGSVAGGATDAMEGAATTLEGLFD
jgi:hypothetical protein